VTAGASGASRTLVVEDDGVGPGSPDGYDGGSGLGLGLIGRLAGRFGGSVSLTARPDGGGARATLAIPWS